MKTLIVDSATNLLYVCLVIDEKIIYEVYHESNHEHSKAIVVEIEKALKLANIKALDLNKVIVGIGPGSYTGVRMGVTVGKTLALSDHIELYQISTLVLMASGSKGKVLSMIDARRGNCFGCIYDIDNSNYVVEEVLINKEELMANKYDNLVNELEFKVNPLKVIKLATKVNEPRTLIPNYLRATEAERNLNA